MAGPPKTLFVFIDGLGLGEGNPEVNPLYRGDCPFLLSLLEGHAKPIDATLGISGAPQSATGQASLFTGENAAEFMGRHVEGTPGPTLKGFVRAHNLFDKLQGRGYSCTFSNAYYLVDLTEVQRRRRQSVTTVASLSAFGTVRGIDELLKNEAVYQDITREVLVKRGYEGPVITPAEGAEHLINIANDHDLTIFEYFQTDLMAHRGTEDDMKKVLTHLNEFFETIVNGWEGDDRLLVMTSDHGNLEDAGTKSHTMNPVPFITLGRGAGHMTEKVERLDEVVPALLELYEDRGGIHAVADSQELIPPG